MKNLHLTVARRGSLPLALTDRVACRAAAERRQEVRALLTLTLPLVFALLLPLNLPAAEKTVDDFRAAAAKANAVLTIPQWEQTPEAVDAGMKTAIAKLNGVARPNQRTGPRQSDFQEHRR